MAPLRKAFAFLALAALAGCGGSSSVQNAASVRFFDALKNTTTASSVTNVRLYIGNHLYSAGSEGPAFKYGDGLAYGDAPSGSGTVNMVVNAYSNQSTTTGSLASLASQTLVQGRHYTLIAYTSAATVSGTSTTDTQALVLFNDYLVPTDGVEYLRIINASPTVATLYLRVYDSNNNPVYSSFTTSTSGSGLAVGGSSGYLAIQPATGATSGDYTLHVYTDLAFSNDIGSAKVSLKVGSPVTAVVYDASATSATQAVSIKSATDTTDGNVTTTTG